MACTIDATPGGATANSYATIDEALAYAETHLSGETWTDETTDRQCAALQTATRLIDAWVEWLGCPADETQALAWPRAGLLTRAGGEIADDVIPNELKWATAELARLLLTSDPTAISDAERENLRRLKAGPVELEFSDSAKLSAVSKILPSGVWGLIQQWARRKVGGQSFQIQRAISSAPWVDGGRWR